MEFGLAHNTNCLARYWNEWITFAREMRAKMKKTWRGSEFTGATGRNARAAALARPKALKSLYTLAQSCKGWFTHAANCHADYGNSRGAFVPNQQRARLATECNERSRRHYEN